MNTLELLTIVKQLEDLLVSNIEQEDIINNCKTRLADTSNPMWRYNKPYLERHLIRAELRLSSNNNKIKNLWESLK